MYDSGTDRLHINPVQLHTEMKMQPTLQNKEHVYINGPMFFSEGAVRDVFVVVYLVLNKNSDPRGTRPVPPAPPLALLLSPPAIRDPSQRGCP